MKEQERILNKQGSSKKELYLGGDKKRRIIDIEYLLKEANYIVENASDCDKLKSKSTIENIIETCNVENGVVNIKIEDKNTGDKGEFKGMMKKDLGSCVGVSPIL